MTQPALTQQLATAHVEDLQLVAVAHRRIKRSHGTAPWRQRFTSVVHPPRQRPASAATKPATG